jgi:hypothetical protein
MNVEESWACLGIRNGSEDGSNDDNKERYGYR